MQNRRGAIALYIGMEKGMDVSSRIVISIFDFLSQKEIPVEALYDFISYDDGGDDHTILLPATLKLRHTFLPWRQFAGLLKAFEEVLQSDTWAEEFIKFAFYEKAPWTAIPQNAALHIDDPTQFYRFTATWFPRFDFPGLDAQVEQSGTGIVLTTTFPAPYGRSQCVALLQAYFVRASHEITSSAPEISIMSERAASVFTIASDVKRTQRTPGVWLRGLIAKPEKSPNLDEFYADLMDSYEKIMTERLRAVRLREPQAHLNAIFSSVDAIILLSDHNGEILSANQKYHDLLAAGAATEHGEPGHHTFLKHLSDQIADVYSSGENEEREFEIKTSNGSQWFTLRSAPIKDAHGIVIACTSVGVDITRQRAADQRISAAKTTEEHVRSLFVSNVSHELRTPLTSILGFVELMQDRQLSPEKTSMYLKTIESNGKSLLSLINNILDIARIEAGERVLETVPVDVPSLISQISSSLEPAVRRKGLDFVIETAPGIPKTIISDPRRILQVVSNLVGNAVKFTAHGFVAIRISPTDPTASGLFRTLEIVVEDSGRGIDKKHMPMLFSPLFLGDKKLDADLPGAGVSLYLSKRIANQLHGDLSLDISAAQGARFVFSVSTGITEETAAAGADLTVQTPKATSEEILSGKRILLMDDVMDIQTLYATILKMAGAQVDVADNGLNGLVLANRATYDLIIVDLKMPEMDGLETTRQLRARGFGRPIIALTSYARPQERTASLEAGCDDHISKPVGASQLVEKIRWWLEKSVSRQA